MSLTHSGLAKSAISGIPAIISYLMPERRAPRVIYYHSVHPELSYSTHPKDFARQLDFLLSQGYWFVSLSEAVQMAMRNELSDQLISLTFDDGYLDNYQYATPLLLERGITATFFLVSSLIGKESLSSNQGNLLYQDRYMMNRAQIQELVGLGFEVGSHTHTHVHVQQLLHSNPYQLMQELHKSKESIENIIGMQVSSFAYPNGQKGVFSKDTKLAVQSAGYSCAATTMWGSITPGLDPYCVPRVEIKHDDSLDKLARKIAGKYEFMTLYCKLFDRSKQWHCMPG